MFIEKLARLSGGVAFRDAADDRGDAGAGGGDGKDDAGTDAAEAERVAAEKVAAEKAAREKDIAVPKARFDEAVGKEREAAKAANARAEKAEKAAAEARAQLEARAAAKDVAKVRGEIEELEEKLDKAVADGDVAARKALRAEIADKRESLAQAEIDRRSSEATARAVEQVRYDSVVDKAETDYPFLVAGTETYNEDITQSLLVMKTGFEAQGMSSSEALKQSIRSLKPQLDAAKAALKSGDKDAEAEAERVAAEKAAAEKAAAGGDKEAKEKAEKAAAARREKAVAEGAAAAKAQAAKAAAAGTADKDVKEIDVKTISDKDYDALPDAEKKRLRGD